MSKVVCVTPDLLISRAALLRCDPRMGATVLQCLRWMVTFGDGPEIYRRDSNPSSNRGWPIIRNVTHIHGLARLCKTHTYPVWGLTMLRQIRSLSGVTGPTAAARTRVRVVVEAMVAVRGAAVTVGVGDGGGVDGGGGEGAGGKGGGGDGGGDGGGEGGGDGRRQGRSAPRRSRCAGHLGVGSIRDFG